MNQMSAHRLYLKNRDVSFSWLCTSVCSHLEAFTLCTSVVTWSLFRNAVYLCLLYTCNAEHFCIFWTTSRCFTGFSFCKQSPFSWLSGEGHLPHQSNPQEAISVWGPCFLGCVSFGRNQAWNVLGGGDTNKIGAGWFERTHLSLWAHKTQTFCSPVLQICL